MVAVKYMGTYDYRPSIPAAIVFASVFGFTTLVHVFQLIRHRTWFFIPFVLGGIFEVIGYAARAVSSNEYPNYTETPMIIQAVFILVGPSLLAASIYMELGRIMMVTGGEKYSLIRRSWLTKIFVLGDVVSFLVQGGGAGMLTRVKTADTGEKIVKIGLIVQIVFFALFIIVSVLFHVRLTRNGAPFEHVVPWRKHQVALYASSMLIFVRSIFRFLEYQLGTNGPLIQHEYWTYIFDALLVVLAMMVFNLAYPGEIGEVLKERRHREKTKGAVADDEVEFLPRGAAPMGHAEAGYAPPTYVPPVDIDTHYAGAYAQPARDQDTHYPGGYSRYEGV